MKCEKRFVVQTTEDFEFKKKNWLTSNEHGRHRIHSYHHWTLKPHISRWFLCVWHSKRIVSTDCEFIVFFSVPQLFSNVKIQGNKLKWMYVIYKYIKTFKSINKRLSSWRIKRPNTKSKEAYFILAMGRRLTVAEESKAEAKEEEEENKKNIRISKRSVVNRPITGWLWGLGQPGARFVDLSFAFGSIQFDYNVCIFSHQFSVALPAINRRL